MIVMEQKEELGIRSAYKAELEVERTDISFRDVSGGRVRIQVTVHNVGAHRSPPTLIRLESAPLGAFVPWQPLTQLLVPSLEPGESREVSTEVERPHPVPLGDFDRVPPRTVLSAVSSPDPDQPPPASDTGPMALLSLLFQGQVAGARGRAPGGQPSLAPDLMELLGREQPHWAGNINVFVNRRPVERHMAQALRIYPGRANLAMFVVGGPGNRDAYAFELVGLAPDWTAALFDSTSNSNLLVGPSDELIQETRWVESNDGTLMLLAIHPPADCQKGKLEVRVTQRSGGKTAVVEFDLDPCAQGAGCYFV